MPAFPPGFELWPAEVINPPPPPIAAAAPPPPQNAPPLLLALPEDYVDAMSWDSWEDTDNGETKASLTTADDLDLFYHEVLPFSDDEDEDEDPDFDDWGIEDGEAEEEDAMFKDDNGDQEEDDYFADDDDAEDEGSSMDFSESEDSDDEVVGADADGEASTTDSDA